MDVSKILYDYIIASDGLYDLFYKRISAYRCEGALSNFSVNKIASDLFTFLCHVKRNKEGYGGLKFFVVNNEVTVSDCAKTIKLLNNFFFQ